ncbi:metallophosphoesterase family protein [Bradyrhizobium arachidis]|uniref:metallophosphoesterase family protein n=1 Tax=Bradyrhizobium TaxID=374 RepID=UPI003D31A1DA
MVDGWPKWRISSTPVCWSRGRSRGLRRIAPVTAIRGKIDTGEWAKNDPDTQIVRLGGRSFYVLHDLQELQFHPARRGFDVVISGHSHRPRIETIDRILYLNPASASRPSHWRLWN